MNHDFASIFFVLLLTRSPCLLRFVSRRNEALLQFFDMMMTGLGI